MNLDKKKGDELAEELRTWELLPSLEAQGDLPVRRQKNYSIYRNEKGCSGQQDIAPNYTPYHVPFTQPRIDIIAGALYQRFTSVDPMVQFVPLSQETTLDQATNVEKLVQAVFDRSDIDVQLPLGVQTAAVCGVCLFRFYPDKDKGMCLETVHPDDFMVYPSTVRRIKDAKTCGHRFWLRVEEIEARDGHEYISGCSEGLTGKNVSSDDIPGSPLLAKAKPEAGVHKSSDLLVECWELITRRDLGDGLKLYRAVVTKEVPRLLQIEELEYSRPWYFEGRLHTEWGGFWPEGCIAQNLQGMQHFYTDLHNAMAAGSFAAMGTKAVISGGVLGDKVVRLGFNDIYQVSGPVNVQTLPSQFNPGVLPMMIQEVAAQGDSIARVSRISQNRQLKGRTTAHEAEMLYQQGEDSEVQYAAHFSRPIAEMAEFALECRRAHPDFFKAHYWDVDVDEPSASAKYRTEVSGRTQSNLPATVSQKVGQALGMATEVNTQYVQMYHMPPPYDLERIADIALEALELNVNVEKLKTPKQDGQMGQPGIPPEMAGNVGQPGMGPGAPVYGSPNGGGGPPMPFPQPQFPG